MSKLLIGLWVVISFAGIIDFPQDAIAWTLTALLPLWLKKKVNTQSLFYTLLFIAFVHISLSVCNVYEFTLPTANLDANSFHINAIKIQALPLKARLVWLTLFEFPYLWFPTVISFIYNLQTSLLLAQTLTIMAFLGALIVIIQIINQMNIRRFIVPTILVIGLLPNNLLWASVLMREPWQLLLICLIVSTLINPNKTWRCWIKIAVFIFLSTLLHKGLFLIFTLMGLFLAIIKYRDQPLFKSLPYIMWLPLLLQILSFTYWIDPTQPVISTLSPKQMLYQLDHHERRYEASVCMKILLKDMMDERRYHFHELPFHQRMAFYETTISNSFTKRLNQKFCALYINYPSHDMIDLMIFYAKRQFFWRFAEVQSTIRQRLEGHDIANTSFQIKHFNHWWDWPINIFQIFTRYLGSPWYWETRGSIKLMLLSLYGTFRLMLLFLSIRYVWRHRHNRAVFLLSLTYCCILTVFAMGTNSAGGAFRHQMLTDWILVLFAIRSLDTRRSMIPTPSYKPNNPTS